LSPGHAGLSRRGESFPDHARSAIRDYDPRKPSLPELLCVICRRFHRYATHCPECGHVQIVTE
jgi:hypothetical protein